MPTKFNKPYTNEQIVEALAYAIHESTFDIKDFLGHIIRLNCETIVNDTIENDREGTIQFLVDNQYLD